MNYNTFNNEHRSPEQDKEAGLRPPQRVKYLLLSLSMQIRPPEIDKLRGALIRMTQGDSYYHNHQDKGFSYRYPLVQYKRIGGHGAVLVIGEAIETVGKLLNATSPTLQIGETTVPYEIQRVTPGNAIVQVWNHRFAYHLRRWLPLNKANYEEYQQMTSMAEKIRFLENIMVGNVLSFCKGTIYLLT